MYPLCAGEGHGVDVCHEGSLFSHRECVDGVEGGLEVGVDEHRRDVCCYEGLCCLQGLGRSSAIVWDARESSDGDENGHEDSVCCPE